MALLGGWLVGWTIRGIIERHLNFKVGTPSTLHNSYYEPCFECNQLMCKAKTYYGSPECVAARSKHSTNNRR